MKMRKQPQSKIKAEAIRTSIQTSVQRQMLFSAPSDDGFRVRSSWGSNSQLIPNKLRLINHQQNNIYMNI